MVPEMLLNERFEGWAPGIEEERDSPPRQLPE